MATTNANHLPQLASYVIRPVLVEAKLITEKHASDAIYVATLAEELRNIEAKIAAMEEAPDIGPSAAPVQLGSGRGPEVWPDANWIRAKSRELAIRLRRVEQSTKAR